MSADADSIEKRSGISGVPMYVAIAALAIWIAFVVAMFALSGTNDVRWTRLVFVFGSVEAIAFAAAGALFGVTVQRERVERAEQKAAANEQDALNGRTLAAVNLLDAGRLGEQEGGSDVEAYGAGDEPDVEIRRRHADAARRLFPDL